MTFHLKPAPADMTLAPIIGVTQPDGIAEVTQAAGTVCPRYPTSTHNGFTLLLDNVIELDDGFVFTGNLSWANAAFPTGKVVRCRTFPGIDQFQRSEYPD